MLNNINKDKYIKLLIECSKIRLFGTILDNFKFRPNTNESIDGLV